MIIAFDLDGTLANIEHRLHFIKKDRSKDKNWPAFFRACVDDKPIVNLVRLANQLVLTGNRVEVWSGRSDIVRRETEEWLTMQAIGYACVRMRKDGDYRADDIVKAEWLDAMPREQWPDVVFDDRKRLVDMWRSRGIICCQVAPGDF